jgi:hypothetical protein
MKCKEAQRLAFKWYGSRDDGDKQAYLEHRRMCAFCKAEFIRNCKEMERDIDTYQYDDSVFEEMA